MAGVFLNTVYKADLPIRLALEIRLFDTLDSAVAKNCQGSTPANTMSAYGAVPSEVSFATCPKIMVNTTIVRNGRINVQVTPIAVCL